MLKCQILLDVISERELKSKNLIASLSQLEQSVI